MYFWVNECGIAEYLNYATGEKFTRSLERQIKFISHNWNITWDHLFSIKMVIIQFRLHLTDVDTTHFGSCAFLPISHVVIIVHGEPTTKEISHSAKKSSLLFYAVVSIDCFASTELHFVTAIQLLIKLTIYSFLWLCISVFME